MKLSAKGGQAEPVAANATGFNPWKFTLLRAPILAFARKHWGAAILFLKQ